MVPPMPTAGPELLATLPPTPTAGTACPRCSVEPVGRLAGVVAAETGATYGIEACPRCGLGRTRPVPADLGPYYDSAYYGNRHGLTARFCRRRRLRFLRRWAGPGAGRALLDYGCGDGDFLAAARGDGWLGVGVERARPADPAGGLPIVASLDELAGRPPVAAATFWHVLEHLPDPVGVLDQVRGGLAPGGVVLATVPNFASWQARAAGAGWLHLDLPRHLWHFTPSALTRTFEAAGFAVAGLSFGELEYDAIGWAQGSLNRHLGGRNEFFRALSGRPGAGSKARRAVQVGLGLGLVATAGGLAVVESWLGRGGTIVIAARARG